MAVRMSLRGAGLAPLATRDQSLDPLSLRDRRRETVARAAPVPLAGKCLGDLGLSSGFRGISSPQVQRFRYSTIHLTDNRRGYVKGRLSRSSMARCR